MASYWATRAQDLFSVITETGDTARAGEVVRLFTRATEREPDGPDTPVWFHRLGVAVGWLADDGLADWDEAVAWLRRALAGPAHPAVDTDEVIGDLVWTMVRRWLVDSDSAACDRLIEGLDALPRPAAGSRAALALDFYRAVGRLGRSGSPGDRQQASALLDACLADVPDDWPLLPETLLEYAATCADEERYDVGLAALTRARALPAQPADDDGSDDDGPDGDRDGHAGGHESEHYV